jgi:hypothetical protein
MKDSLAMSLKTNGGKMSVYGPLAMLMKRHGLQQLSRDRYDNKHVSATVSTGSSPRNLRVRDSAKSVGCRKTTHPIIRHLSAFHSVRSENAVIAYTN